MSGDHLEFDGEVIESIRGVVTVLIQLDDVDNVIKCRIGGKMKQFKIKVIVGDTVRIRVSPYDLTRGIVFHRYKSPGSTNNNKTNNKKYRKKR